MVIRPISILGGLCISGVFQKLRLQQLGALFSVICVSCGCVCTTDGRTDGRTYGRMDVIGVQNRIRILQIP